MYGTESGSPGDVKLPELSNPIFFVNHSNSVEPLRCDLCRQMRASRG